MYTRFRGTVGGQAGIHSVGLPRRPKGRPEGPEPPPGPRAAQSWHSEGHRSGQSSAGGPRPRVGTKSQNPCFVLRTSNATVLGAIAFASERAGLNERADFRSPRPFCSSKNGSAKMSETA
ncbi:unnamed protein product [Ixodes persulcatus]